MSTPCKSFVRTRLTALFALLSCCAIGCNDESRVVAPCQGVTCSGHGTCANESNQAACHCNAGWAGELCEACAAGFHDDGVGNCVVDAVCLASTCSGHGTCTASGGSLSCGCEAGYSGERCESCAADFHLDAAGHCVADEKCGTDTCNHGGCDDAGGVIACTCERAWTGSRCDVCAAGFHGDGPGACALDQQCQPTTCSGRGACTAADGAVSCACGNGYAGSNCEQCRQGFHRDATAACVADEQCAAETCGHGTCALENGVVDCTCQLGWAGPRCGGCAAGYHLSNGSCVLDEQCLATSCSGHGQCGVSGGVVSCACADGYDGTYCAGCEAGYHWTAAGDCALDEECGTDICNHGSCDDASGLVVCTCQSGWTGPRCNQCASGYHLSGEACVLDEQCMPTSCSAHGTCSVAGGVVSCVCSDGYEGNNCERCQTTHHRDLQGDCAVNESCQLDSCNGHGVCSDATGVVLCSCSTGWAGTSCNACAPGFHASADDCILDEQCLSTSCSGHGACSVSNGAVSCGCADGYSGSYCEQCAQYFHRDASAACAANEPCEEGGCGNGSCDDSSGVVTCTCDAGWAGPRCGGCAAGYHLSNRSCVLDEQCLATSCSGHGTCSVNNGVVSCDCADGYDGAYCDQCEGGFHRNHLGLCVPDEVCTEALCNHGRCSNATGIAVCTCDQGYAGTRCELCAAGFHLEAGLCVVDEECQPDTCSGHGTCAVVGGKRQCACNVGYSGPACGQCYAGYQVSVVTGSCQLPCDGNPDSTEIRCEGTCTSGISEQNCGGCGIACGAGERCQWAGQEATCVCPIGDFYGSCADQECVDFSSDEAHCGTCENRCAAGERCYLGTCVVPNACQDMCGDQDLCCQDMCLSWLPPWETRQNCGGCGVTCASDEACLAGRCTRGDCEMPCGAEWGVLCCQAGDEQWCVEATRDNNNCGGCGKQCAPGEQCREGACRCGGVVCDGKCVQDLSSDNENCGACGHACDTAAGQRCAAGNCLDSNATCSPGCSGTQLCCADGENPVCFEASWTYWERNHCGGCNACPENEQCQNGVCKCGTAPQFTTACSGSCTDLFFDEQNCGNCGSVCQSGERCVYGACQAPTGTCGGVCSGADELCCTDANSSDVCLPTTQLQRDWPFCGGCQICAQYEECVEQRPGSGQFSCACPSEWGNTNYALCDGGCTPLNTLTDCGACGQSCSGAEHCAWTGQYACECSPSPQFGTCDGGCVDLYADESNCGACGNACAAGAVCVSGECIEGNCSLTCNEDMLCCNEACVNAAGMATDRNNCGGCGIQCTDIQVCEQGDCKMLQGDSCSDPLQLNSWELVGRDLCDFHDTGEHSAIASDETTSREVFYRYVPEPGITRYFVNLNPPFFTACVYAPAGADLCSPLQEVRCGNGGFEFEATNETMIMIYGNECGSYDLMIDPRW